MKFCYSTFLKTIGLLITTLSFSAVFAQKDSSFNQKDSMQKKKNNFWAKITKGITVDEPNPEAEKVGINKNDLPFMHYKGQKINSIRIIRLSFNQDINDTTPNKKQLGKRIAKAFHKNTKEEIIKSNLYYKEGDNINPYLLADNERHLRSLVFLQDAKIVLQTSSNHKQDVDMIVYTKDVFSIGVGGGGSSLDNYNLELKEENLVGTASKLSVSTLHDVNRSPRSGWALDYIKRNINKTFSNLSVGFKTFNSTFNTGRPDETLVYAKLERPMISPYLPWIGSAELNYHNATNGYFIDSVFQKNFRYSFIDADAWIGYNLGTGKFRRTNQTTRIHKFVALRVFHQDFAKVPGIFENTYNYSYADVTGALASINIFKQEFYKTKYIYGFGRYEDIPEGFSLSLIGGWTNKQNLNRQYYGLDFARNYLSKKANYYNYTFKVGGFADGKNFEDVDVLFNIENFTKLKKLSAKWSIRNYTDFGITHQINPNLNPPLFLTSRFGLEEFANGNIMAQTRITLKKEAVFFSPWKIIGFKLAPLLFVNASYVVQQKEAFEKGDLFTSIGAGVRSRNENLIFGTIEARGYYFPRVNADMQQFKFEFKSNLQYQYNSQYIKKPSFVSSN